MKGTFGVAVLDIVMYVVQLLEGIIKWLGLGAYYEYDSIAFLKDHEFIGRGFVQVVISWKIIKLELQILNFEIIAFNSSGRLKNFGLFGVLLVENDLDDRCFTGLGKAHDAYVHYLQ